MSKSSQSPKKSSKPSQKQLLENLRSKFRFYADGRPDIYSFGVFKGGLTIEEVQDYLRVRTNNWNIKKAFKKYQKLDTCDTCEVVTVNGVGILLIYRCDVQRHIENVLEGTPTYFD